MELQVSSAHASLVGEAEGPQNSPPSQVEVAKVGCPRAKLSPIETDGKRPCPEAGAHAVMNSSERRDTAGRTAFGR